ncbi:uncharacterized protein LOC135221882 isoform X2 [Macrobrachium nipponense]|uniref:uncharacterized protein LOC135221882 isoform X2 n=1 Tax=Macrobrachium nipponense TaxID=159736 RepID=UPI0030C8870F
MKMTLAASVLGLMIVLNYAIEAKPTGEPEVSVTKAIIGNLTASSTTPSGRCFRICFDHGIDMVGECKEKCEEDEREIYAECQISCPPDGCKRRFSCHCCAKKKQM